MIDSTSTPHRWDYHYSELGTARRYGIPYLKFLERVEQRECDIGKVASSALIAAWDEDEK